MTHGRPGLGSPSLARTVIRRVTRAAVPIAAASLLAVLAPVASPVRADGPGDWKVWLDAPIPRDAAPGSTVHIGFIAWDATDQSTVNVFGFEVRLHPASGKGKTSVGQVTQDWPGHSATDLVVPRGGLGRLEFGVLWPGGVSGSGRTITLDFQRIPVGGVGPPPGISLRRIGTVVPATSSAPVAGQPLGVDLTFAPRLGWPAGSVTLPDQLTLRVRRPGQDQGEEVAATLADRTAARYRATVVLDRPGAYILEAALEPDAPPADRFTESEVRIVADAPTRSAAPPTPEAGSPAPVADGGPPVVVLALLGLVALVIAGGLGLLVRFLRAEW